MTRHRLLDVLEHLKLWTRHGDRVPHKPLLLLLVLGRLWRGQPRLASYERDIQEPLKNLLRDFAPSRKVLHPENPFWHLQTEGLWELAGDVTLAVEPGHSATHRALVANNTSGGLTEPIYKLLRRDPRLVREATALLLARHFPPSMHDAIRDRVGLPRDSAAGTREGDALAGRRQRDSDFRAAVLRAYEGRCSVCDFDLRIYDVSFGLDAAHIKWYSHDGPDLVPNGLALCTFHLTAFDRGVLGLEPKSGMYRLLVSNELTGQSPAFSEVLSLSGRALRQPQEEEQRPAVEYVNWHRRQVFRGQPRSGTQ